MKDTNYMDLFERRMERGPLHLLQMTDILHSLGLTIPPLDVTDQDGLDFAQLLTFVGEGNFDFDSGIWTPSSSQVFLFDGEAFDIAHMYCNFIKGLQAISEGELAFSDVEQDDSRVNLEELGGIMEVRYCLNGVECRFDAQFMGDWLDVNIQDAVNRELEKQGIGKRFYATDGIQGNVIFFCTEDWARTFEEATLCYMSESGNIR